MSPNPNTEQGEMHIRKFLVSLTRNPISLAGAAITTASALLIITLVAVEIVGEEGHPYLGIIAYLILPAFFLAGLALIPWGKARERRRRREQAGAAEHPFPIIDLNNDRTRNYLLTFVGFTTVNLILVATVTYKGVEFLDSNQFCGDTCHVLEPEYTAYQNSPHSRVRCVECHIGPGASWFVKAKLSGVRELFATVFNTYPRPIPTPVHNLRPAQDTCEECHWPTKFHGVLPRVMTSFQEDSANTTLKTVLMLKVGGQEGGASQGIHWHVDPDIQVRYRSDESRETIYEVELTREDGSVTHYHADDATATSADGQDASAEGATWRVMDCVDCHNRPTHIYRAPGRAVDIALAERRIAPDLPFIKREGVAALRSEYESSAAARAGIAGQILDFYRTNYPELLSERGQDIERAGRELGEIWARNVFPHMNITWNTYPNHIGHPDFSGGCFRCHSGQHSTRDGVTISQNCENCHSLLAWNEPEPEILQQVPSLDR